MTRCGGTGRLAGRPDVRQWFGVMGGISGAIRARTWDYAERDAPGQHARRLGWVFCQGFEAGGEACR
jgi:hypothetical protein